MRERVLAILKVLVIVIIIGIAVLSYANAQSTVCEGVIQATKAGEISYKLGETVKLTYAVRNTCSEPVKYTFSSSMQFDLWIKRGDKEIYRMSKGRMYAMVITTLELQPGETKTFDIEWNQKDNAGKSVGPGMYEVYARLTPNDNAPAAVKTKVQLGKSSMAVAPVTVSEAIRLADRMNGRKVQISATYRGWQPNPDDPNTKSGPPVTRSDWAICDSTGCMYVTGNSHLNPDKDLDTKVTVVGKLAKTRNGQVYMILDSITTESSAVKPAENQGNGDSILYR